MFFIICKWGRLFKPPSCLFLFPLQNDQSIWLVTSLSLHWALQGFLCGQGHDLGEDDCTCFWVFHIFTLILENGHETCPLNSCSIGQLVWGGEMRHEIWNLKILSPGWALLWRHCFRNLPPTSNHVPYQTAWVQTSAPLLFYPWRQQVMAQVVDLSPLTRDSQMDRGIARSWLQSGSGPSIVGIWRVQVSSSLPFR